MAGRRSQKPAIRKRAQPGRTSDKRVLDALAAEESVAVLRILMDRHPGLRDEAEQIAQGLVSSPSAEDITQDVISAITLVDEDQLAGRAGKHSWGYVEPGEAALQLLEEAVEPIIADMKRRMELGLAEAAETICRGIVIGLNEIDGTGEDGLLGWAPDFPAEEACHALAELIRACPMAGRKPSLKRLVDALARDVPGWSEMLARAAKQAMSRR